MIYQAWNISITNLSKGENKDITNKTEENSHVNEHEKNVIQKWISYEKITRMDIFCLAGKNGFIFWWING
jgi:hypothetical protein